MTTANPTLSDELLDDVKQAASDAILTALKVYSGIILAGLNSISQTPSVSELAAVGLQVEGTIISAFPQLEQAEIQVLATDAKTAFSHFAAYVQSQAQNLAPAAAPPAAP